MKKYTLDERLLIIRNMEKYGGSFVKALAQLYLVADLNNIAIIEDAWPATLNKYFVF